MASDWMNERHLDHRSLRIVDLVSNDGMIVGRSFEDCTIYGRAVVVPLDGIVFERNTFEADPTALFWEIPENRDRIVGAIGLKNCAFRRCVFQQIGIAGTRQFIERFKKSSRTRTGQP